MRWEAFLQEGQSALTAPLVSAISTRQSLDVTLPTTDPSGIKEEAQTFRLMPMICS